MNVIVQGAFPSKLRRAQEHLVAFNNAYEWWISNQPHRVAEEIDTETDTKRIVLIADQQPPERLSLILGDAIQNLRAALDYLVADLARHASGGHLMPRVESALQYPVATSRPLFKDALRRGRLGCVPARAQARIQHFQPNRRGHDAASHPLWMLQELSNIDKHRRLPLLSGVVASTEQSIDIGHAEWFQAGMTGPFEGKAILIAYGPADADVKVDLTTVSVEIVLGKGLPGEGQPVHGVFEAIWLGLQSEVFGPLSAFLT